MLRTGIVIVTHNSGAHIGACLEAVNRFRGPEDSVMVIDNGSSIETEALPAGVRLVQNKHNAGFAGAVNQGFAALRDEVDAVLLLNPDVVLRTPTDAMAEACQRVGLACGMLTDAAGNAQVGFSFRRFPSAATLFFETVGLNKIWKSNPVNRRYRCLDVDHGVAQAVEQPAGAMLMIRNDVFTRLGGFDDEFHPVWFEDVDFCRRAAKEGFQAAYVPSVRGVHAGGHSVLQLPDSNRRQYWYASLMRYSRKHFERAGRGLVAGGVVAAAITRTLSSVFRFHEGSLKEAAMNVKIAQTALVYPKAKPKEAGPAVADVRSRVSNEGIPSNENTERTLKRLHAR